MNSKEGKLLQLAKKRKLKIANYVQNGCCHSCVEITGTVDDVNNLIRTAHAQHQMLLGVLIAEEIDEEKVHCYLGEVA